MERIIHSCYWHILIHIQHERVYCLLFILLYGFQISLLNPIFNYDNSFLYTIFKLNLYSKAIYWFPIN